MRRMPLCCASDLGHSDMPLTGSLSFQWLIDHRARRAKSAHVKGAASPMSVRRWALLRREKLGRGREEQGNPVAIRGKHVSTADMDGVMTDPYLFLQEDLRLYVGKPGELLLEMRQRSRA